MSFPKLFRNHLESHDVPSEYIEIALNFFGDSTGVESSTEVAETKPRKRYLGPNTAPEEPELPPLQIESPVGVIIITPYKKSNALLGDFRVRYSGLKDNYLKRSGNFKYNPHLKTRTDSSEAGWIFQSANMKELESKLKSIGFKLPIGQ